MSSLLYDVKHDTSSRLFSASWDHTVREWDIEEESNINTMVKKKVRWG